MKDIPRNELLDKLAAGWKVRRKKWSADNTFSVKGQESVPAKALIADDWEGEPPGPVKLFAKASITEAITLRDKSSEKAFVRRADWVEHRRICENVFNLVKSDILAHDWEVWG